MIKALYSTTPARYVASVLKPANWSTLTTPKREVLTAIFFKVGYKQLQIKMPVYLPHMKM
jgi:hypothetical protein